MGSPVDDALDRLPKDLREDVEYLRAVLVFATADAYSEKAALTALDRLTDDLATVRSALEQLREERDTDRIAFVNRESFLSDEARRWENAHDKAALDWREAEDRAEAAEAEVQRLREGLRLGGAAK